MRTRYFQQLRRPVSEVGLGCWQIGGDWGEVDEHQAIQILQTAHDNGIDFFDTADVYGQGLSETIVGRFLKITRSRPFVATKVGRFPTPGWPDNFRPEVMRKHVEASLRRLGVETIDLLQLHCIPPEEVERHDMFGTIIKLRDEGKVRSYGASVETIAEGLAYLEVPGLASLQIIFNLFRQEATDELFKKAEERRISIIARLPLASGVLAGRQTHATTFGEDDHRNFNRDGEYFNVGETFSGIPFDTAIDLANEVAGFSPIAYSPAEFAQRWVLDHPAVTTMITGASKPQQVYENAGVTDLPPLDEETLRDLRGFYDDEIRPHIRGEI